MIHTISGIVIDGDKIGRTIGFPTANIAYESDELWNSVFKVNIVVDGVLYAGMWVNAVWKKMFEVHIFDFDEDIYGENVDIYILKKIRDNQKFENLQELTKQLEQDKKDIQSIELRVATFGTFDVFHRWHIYYLESAKRYGTSLHTIIARDSTVERIKWFTPKDNELQRQKNVQDSDICDSVILGDTHDPLIPLQKIQPHIICLGYDQKSFPKQLDEYVTSTWIQIVRMESFEPEIYKSSKLK